MIILSIVYFKLIYSYIMPMQIFYWKVLHDSWIFMRLFLQSRLIENRSSGLNNIGISDFCGTTGPPKRLTSVLSLSEYNVVVFNRGWFYYPLLGAMLCVPYARAHVILYHSDVLALMCLLVFLLFTIEVTGAWRVLVTCLKFEGICFVLTNDGLSILTWKDT